MRISKILFATLVASASTAAADKAPRAPDFAESPAPRTDVDRDRGASTGTVLLLPVDVVLFDFDSTALDDADAEQINAAARWQRNNPGYDLVLEGHADAVGPSAYNMDLSTRRALEVTEALIAAGADPSRIVLDARGESMPRSSDPRVNREVVMYARQIP